MSTPKVSVVIPVYNTDRYLRKTLETLVDQSLREIEIIAVDDGSTDGSLKILREYAQNDSRITVLVQPNSGAAVARNNGLAHAQGEFVIFLDSDDYYDLDMLERMSARATQFDADLCVCGVVFFDDETGEEICKAMVKIEELGGLEVFSRVDIPKHILSIAIIGTARLCLREFLLAHKIEYQNLSRSEDVLFSIMTSALSERIVFVNEPFIHYRQHATSTSSKRSDQYKNVFAAFGAAREALQELGLFAFLQASFYDHYLTSLCYQYNFTNEEFKDEFVALVKQSVPRKYVRRFKRRMGLRLRDRLLRYVRSLLKKWKNR
ncbi:hypothetical protein AGMMS50229_10400 [Campylobacterota bacterium]|nr:hypothetical protein AGMMS50229_10400 [Campylobacterota bacterium]